jgi:Rps23 Pro-64 3,4-dihydroxylase Tpa1-like proline 4-hydroxylase
VEEEEEEERAELLGSPPPGVHAGAAAQLMRSCLSDHLAAALPPSTLLPSDGYVTNAMLSVYAPGAPGFVPHTDHCGPSDPRRVTAVYYPNARKWSAADGGQLVLWPRETGGGGEKGSSSSRRREVAPVGDRLVVFYSDEVEHEVLPVSPGAQEERLALSFWYLKPML